MLLQLPYVSLPPRPVTTPRDWLQCDALTLRRGERFLLDAVSLRCRTGEWLGLIDPSGESGAALMALIEGRGRPARGTLCWPNGRPTFAGVVGGLRWPPGLLLRQLCQSLGVSEVLPSIEDYGLQRLLMRPLCEWPTVDARLVQLAIANALPAETLLLDDPLQALNSDDRFRMLAALRSARRRWPQALLRLQERGGGESLCDRQVYLDGGRVCSERSTPERAVGKGAGKLPLAAAGVLR